MTDSVLHRLAERIQAIVPLSPMEHHNTFSFDVQKSRDSMYLLIPKCRGNFSIVCNGKTIDTFTLPAPYHSDFHPFVCDLTPHLTEQPNTVCICPADDFELVSDIIIGAPK
jgi:hypothetical protein